MIKLGFIGAGHMATALAQGLVARRVMRPAQMLAADIDARARRRFSRATGAKTCTDLSEVLAAAPALVLAVKPQSVAAVIERIGALANGARPGQDKLVISIAAGIPLATLEGGLPGARVIRVMPNAPAMVGEGMAALARGRRAKPADLAFAHQLFVAVGEAVVVKDEALLDAVTALSGSGPAYVYLFIKALTEAACAEGLSAPQALAMALQTVRGAEAQMRQSKLAPDELIRMVASPGGTTEAALRAFEQGNFVQVVGHAVKAAATRSRELGRSR
ncbi:MAG TPA: pyrroline-5-carboxylate reductase [Candidatus Binataceae bacterium]|nr:pyrroline-5-carboxylate reductase [Candidatus Binataceae bacterium]